MSEFYQEVLKNIDQADTKILESIKTQIIEASILGYTESIYTYHIDCAQHLQTIGYQKLPKYLGAGFSITVDKDNLTIRTLDAPAKDEFHETILSNLGRSDVQELTVFQDIKSNFCSTAKKLILEASKVGNTWVEVCPWSRGKNIKFATELGEILVDELGIGFIVYAGIDGIFVEVVE